METAESVQGAVRAWRREHRRGPLPVVLRRRVAALADTIGEDATRRAVGVRVAIIRRWQGEYGAGSKGARGRRSAFVELGPQLAPPVAGGPGGLRIEFTSPGGCLVRIEGARDAAEVAAIVGAALRRGEGV